jgi:hypothetical protein
LHWKKPYPDHLVKETSLTKHPVSSLNQVCGALRIICRIIQVLAVIQLDDEPGTWRAEIGDVFIIIG